jgi:hypothetical protein
VAGSQALTGSRDRDKFGDDALDADRPKGRPERTAGQGVSMRNLGRWMVVGVASVALTLGIVALSSRAEAAAACLCPRIYAPVACGNGWIYTNSCVATCNRATDCVPAPWYTPRIPVAPKRSVVGQDQPDPS